MSASQFAASLSGFRGMQTPIGYSEVAAWAAQYDLAFRALIVTNDAELNLSRRQESGPLASAYGQVTTALSASGIAVPREFKDSLDLIGTAEAAGFTVGDSNPNGPGAGLIRPLSEVPLALGVPFADAPAALVLHGPSGTLMSVSGVWHMLPSGLVQYAVRTLRNHVIGLGYPWAVDDVRVMTSPGAGVGFGVDATGRDNLLRHSNRWVFEPFIEERTSHGRQYSFDLAGAFAALWEKALSREVVFFDDRNVLTYTAAPGKPRLFASKREEERERSQGRPLRYYWSNMIAGVVIKNP